MCSCRDCLQVASCEPGRVLPAQRLREGSRVGTVRRAWLVLAVGASRLGGAAVMNLGHAYANSSSYALSTPRTMRPIFSPYLRMHAQGVTTRPGHAMVCFDQQAQEVQNTDCFTCG